jgi:hypothetical protein
MLPSVRQHVIQRKGECVAGQGVTERVGDVMYSEVRQAVSSKKGAGRHSHHCPPREESDVTMSLPPLQHHCCAVALPPAHTHMP